LHIGNALSAVANRRFGDWLLLRIDDTDPARNVPGGEEAILDDLRWLGLDWEEGPVRQSERGDRYREAAERLGTDRFDGVTLLREDGTATYHLASVVDDADFAITHVIRGNDHRPNEALHRRLREAGIPAAAVRAYLEELDLPRHDVHLDLARIRRLAIESIERMSDDELAASAGVDPRYAPVMRGARDLNEAARFVEELLHPEPAGSTDPATLRRFEELADLPPRDLLRELKAAGGNLRALRVALTGRATGPELSAILAALPKEEALRRVDQALQHAQP